MNSQDLLALAPLLFLAAGSVALLLLIALRPQLRQSAGPGWSGVTQDSRHVVAWASRLFLLGALASLLLAARIVPRQVTALLIVDGHALFFQGLLLCIALAVSLLATPALRHETRPREFHVLLLLASFGGSILVASSHLGSLALGLETLSISLFGMIGYRRGERRGAEAAIKYLILSGASTALLLFGMALVYAAVGTMVLSELNALIRSVASRGPLVPAGLALILVGLSFKLALVPFHMWAADVYQGAPAPVAAFVATASKTAIFGLLLRFVLGLGVNERPDLLLGLSIISGLSMLAGNLLALLQTNLKRLLAYSSIAHLGYLLLALLPGGRLGLEAASYYLVAYSVTLLGTFGIITLLARPPAEAGGAPLEAEDLEDYRGLYWRRPLLAALMTACLLSLAGIPLTAGFLGKFYVLAAGINGAHWALALVLVVSSAIGLYYYLRVVVIMFAPLDADEPARLRVPVRVPVAGALLLGVLGLLLLWLGVLPGALQLLIRLSMLQPL